MKETMRDARILVVDDAEPVVEILCEILGLEGYRDVVPIVDPHEALREVERLEPDLVLLDLHMPGLNGFEVMAEINARFGPLTYLPVLVLTADLTPEARPRALMSGAKDFLTKPFDSSEVVVRVRNLLETRLLHLALRDENAMLEMTVTERTRELERMRVEVLHRLALAAEFRDDGTLRHTRRVGSTAAVIARRLGIDPLGAETLARAAQLHDVGKIGIPDSILLKRGRLDVPEYERVKEHTVIGARILSENRFDLLRTAEEIALTHHERWDGGGYPHGLRGDEIPLVGRIVALADVLDALLHERPYKPAWTVDRALREIRAQSGRQFDPDVVAAFFDARNVILAVEPDAVAG